MNFNRVRRLHVGLCTLLILLSASMAGCGISGSAPQLPPNSALQNCDIAMRKGGSAANIFLSAADTGMQYTHAGIIIFIENEPMVIHSVPDEAEPGDIDRIKIEPLSDFYWGLKALAGAIFRPTSLSDEQRRVATKEAYRWYEKRVPFDADYELGDTSKIYCTELLNLAFDKVGYDVSAGNFTELESGLFIGKFIFPSDIIDNTDMELIYSFE